MALLTARPTSPTEGVHLVENFIGNGTITTNLIGQNMWTLTTIGTAGTVSYLTTLLDNDSPLGGIRLLTGSNAAGDGHAVSLRADSALFPTSVGGGGFATRVNIPDIASNTLTDNDFVTGIHSTVTATAPTDGISWQSISGVMTLRSDSADHGDTSQAAAGVGSLTSGTTLVKGVPHALEAQWSGENGQGGPLIVEGFIDDEPCAQVLCNLDNDESAEPSIVCWGSAGGAVTLESDVHNFEYWQFMNYPTAPAV
ncbi:hypothetical protein LCGC14_0397410 [marine sediment metagenome]|uniref:Uncharacterized protein n=1 Tax=marine sediment metagenome TaxID=412755 RepID=A0A0F9W706_9ZZZZ